MIINREKDIDEVNFTFRIFNVLPNVCNLIVKDLDKKIKFSVHEQKSNFNILIDIESVSTSESIKRIIRDYKLEEIDIYISLISTYDHGGLLVPQNVSRIIRDFDCDLNFSFVSC